MDIIPLSAFQDNYIWLLRRDRHAAVVDPGDAAVVRRYLAEQQLQLSAILLTHDHADHVGGVAALAAEYDIPIYGSAKEQVAGVNHPVADGAPVVLNELDLTLEALDVPGHTASDIAFYAPGMVFTGDTLFSAGCGRLFGGTAAQLYHSLARLAALPDDTRVYCGHEYTLSNLAFAAQVEPGNAEQVRWHEHCIELREVGKPTLPSTIALEKAINPFLRTDEEAVIEAVAVCKGERPANGLACFTALRVWKDGFR